MLKNLTLITFCLVGFVVTVNAQNKTPNKKAETPAAPKVLKKSNQRPAAPLKSPPSEPFEKATVQTMAAQCVSFDTEAGFIELEMFPESAPETVRSFLNLAATGAFDTTTFSRVVPGFIIQGGNLGTREKLTPELANRANRAVPDEPNLIKHERGIISMARSDAPNSDDQFFYSRRHGKPSRRNFRRFRARYERNGNGRCDKQNARRSRKAYKTRPHKARNGYRLSCST